MLNAIHICAMMHLMRSPNVLQFTQKRDKLQQFAGQVVTYALSLQQKLACQYTTLMALNYSDAQLRYMTRNGWHFPNTLLPLSDIFRIILLSFNLSGEILQLAPASSHSQHLWLH